MTLTETPVSLELVRMLPASADRVYAALTRPEKMRAWFGPGPMTVPIAQVDLRIGGIFRLEFRDPEGVIRVVTGSYREIVPNEKLVFSWKWEDDASPETIVTIFLREKGNQTEVRLTHEGFVAKEARDHHYEGWIANIGNLEERIGMRVVNCADLGCCNDVLSAPSDDQLNDSLFSHAEKLHPDSAKTMTPEQISQIKTRISQVTFTL